MIRRAILAATLLYVVGVPQAASAFDIELLFDVDRTAYLHNTTGADISFDGYQIISETNALDVAGWDSISDRIPARLNELMDNLGAGAVAFGELNPNSSQVAEGNLTGVGVLKAGQSFSLGKPFGEGGYWAYFLFKVGGQSTPFPGQSLYIPRIPEPSTMVLAALAGLGLVVTRFRSRR